MRRFSVRGREPARPDVCARTEGLAASIARTTELLVDAVDRARLGASISDKLVRQAWRAWRDTRPTGEVWPTEPPRFFLRDELGIDGGGKSILDRYAERGWITYLRAEARALRCPPGISPAPPLGKGERLCPRCFAPSDGRYCGQCHAVRPEFRGDVVRVACGFASPVVMGSDTEEDVAEHQRSVARAERDDREGDAAAAAEEARSLGGPLTFGAVGRAWAQRHGRDEVVTGPRDRRQRQPVRRELWPQDEVDWDLPDGGRVETKLAPSGAPSRRRTRMPSKEDAVCAAAGLVGVSIEVPHTDARSRSRGTRTIRVRDRSRGARAAARHLAVTRSQVLAALDRRCVPVDEFERRLRDQMDAAYLRALCESRGVPAPSPAEPRPEDET